MTTGPEDYPDDVVVPDDLSTLFDHDAAAAPGPAASPTTPPPTDSGAPASGEQAGGSGQDEEAERGAEPKVIYTTAVVLTAVRQAKVLASLMALAGIEAAVVPSSRGAIAVRYVEQLESETDPGELLSGIPREAEALGAALSVAGRSEVVLLAARVEEVGGEISGQVKARRYRGGQIVEDPPPGLVLGQADAVAERLLIGLVQAPQVEGYISSSDLRGAGGGRSFFGRRRKEGDPT